ncbi:hypothetical protein V6N11_044307 [Hibiscus sabdariffa]|uniref:Uncharacterized protein n=1 Tax=Hibiscus sabdariffa TaxID=183260 RepID=A0ABR2REU3_9ROSI
MWRVTNSSVGMIPSDEPGQSSVPNISENIGMIPSDKPSQSSVPNISEHMPEMSVHSTPLDVHEGSDHSITGAQVSAPRASDNSDLQNADAITDHADSSVVSRWLGSWSFREGSRLKPV